MLRSTIEKLDNADFREKYYDQYQVQKPPYWNRIKFEGKRANGYLAFENIKILNAEQKGVHLHPISPALLKSDIDFDANRYGLDSFYPQEVLALHNSGLYIRIDSDAKITKPLYIEYMLDEKNPQLLDFIVINAGEGSKSNIVVSYKSGDGTSVYKNSVLKVRAREYSELKLSRVQNLNLDSYNCDFSDFNVDDNAKVKYYTAEFGAKVNVGSSTVYLNGYRSEMETLPAYLADQDRKVDLAYSIIFFGKKTDGQINGCGAVMDTATKVFRGNIFFEKGSSGSAGREGSFDILLDKTVQSHSIPTLFCEEDDVIGEHYASIGRIDESQLLYLMSRGIPEKLARKVIVESSFRPILDNIDHEETRAELLEELNQRIK